MTVPDVPIVGLGREREVLTVALQAGRHVVIEGPPGTGKSTLLRHIARQAGRAVLFAEGNAELTPARLIGQYDPAQVLTSGYVPASFTDGPLLRAMRSGALLYLEEFNRVPEETLNVLITVLAEGEIAVPRLGMVQAEPGFRLVAAMNPFDAIGTARVSHAIADRICRVVLGYQDAAAERAITTAVTSKNGQVVDFAVTLTRATREHRDVRMGSSVRGAIDLVLLLTGLARLRGEDALARDTARDAAHAALSGRIRLADGCDRTPEAVLDELLDALWEGRPGRPEKADRLPTTAGGQAHAGVRAPRCAGSGPAGLPGGPPAGPSWPPGTPRWPPYRPAVGQLDEDAFAAVAGGRPGRRAGHAGRPGPGHRPAAAGGGPAAGRAAVLPAGPGGPASPPGVPGGSQPAVRTGIWTWTGPWTGGPGRGRRRPPIWSLSPGSRTAGHSACWWTAAARCPGWPWPSRRWPRPVCC